MSADEIPAGSVRLVVEYDGARFVGWQVQREGRSVQGVLQAAVEKLVGGYPGSMRLTGAGRTDSGVHARGQVVSLESPRPLPTRAWVAGLNSLLPEDLAIVRAQSAPAGFDARRWARGKRYAYSIHNFPTRSPLFRGTAWNVRRPLDLAAMRQALPALIGQHDFSALRAANCAAKTTVREIRSLTIAEEGALIVLRVDATAFLKHMVRNLVGTLVEVGHGKRAASSLPALLESRDRTQAGPTAPPHGLVLEEVFYLPGLANPRPRLEPGVAVEDPALPAATPSADEDDEDDE